MASGQRPGESDKDYLRRLAIEEAALRKARNAEADAKVERDRAAAAAEAFARGDLDDINEALKNAWGVNLDDIAEAQRGTDIPELISTEDAVREIKKAAKKGNKAKADRIYRKNRKAIEKAAKVTKEQKKGWLDCAVVAVLMLAGMGTGGYFLVDGAVEVITALAR